MASTSSPLPASPLLMLLPVPLLLAMARPCSGVDAISTYCAKNGTSAQTQDSIDQVLAALVPRASAAYYATATAGRSSSAVWGLAQCRGDVPRQDCSLCLAAAAKKVASSCRGSSDGRVFYDYCLLRYSSSNFLGLADTGYTLILLNTQNATGVDLAAFDQAQGKLVSRVASEAGDTANKGLATDTTRVGGGGGGAKTTIYGLGWCTRDITVAYCGLCVAQAVAELPNYCRYRRGCRVIYSTCMVRYEVYPFFFPLGGAGASADELGQCDKIVLN
uniref:Gnk2-homologous domain-containing protein n=2 Tax=Triticum urartu TaxID=4572 RepID=A0A8R7JVZ4_TRIUA